MKAPAPHTKEETFNLRLDPALKAAFLSAARCRDRPAAQVLRDLMRAYVARQQAETLPIEARRQARLIAAEEEGAESDTLRWLDEVADTRGWRA